MKYAVIGSASLLAGFIGGVWFEHEWPAPNRIREYYTQATFNNGSAYSEHVSQVKELVIDPWTHLQGQHPLVSCTNDNVPREFVLCAFTRTPEGAVTVSFDTPFTGVVAVMGNPFRIEDKRVELLLQDWSTATDDAIRNAGELKK